MKSRGLRKIISLISSFSLLLQSFVPLAIAMPVYAEDASGAAVIEVSPTPEVTPEITPEVSPTPEITPEPTVLPTPTVEITPEVSVTPEPTPEPIPAEQQNNEEPQNNSPPESTPTPTAAPITPLSENLNVLTNLEQSITEIKPTLSTDKSDYFPTDTVHITGTGFLANTNYTLHISSQDNPIFNYRPEVTSDENGNISFSFTLDGNYRPNYQIEAIDVDGAVVATYEFTDSRYAHSATVNGSSTTSVTPGENITVNVTAWLDSGDDWEGTLYRISTSNSGSYICQNTSDHTDNVSGTASFTESFNITAPNTPGTYNLYLRVSGKDNCNSDNSDALTLINAIIVSPIYTADTFSSNTYTSPKNTFQYGDTVYGKGTRATAANIRLRYLDSHNDVKKVCNYVNSTSTTCDYILPIDARTGTWKIQIGRCDSNCSNSNNWNYSGYAEDTFTVNEAPYTPTRICHATGSEKYVSQTPSTVGVLMGHVGQSHQDGEDIIPIIPVYLPAGQNWDPTGQAIWNNNCVVPPTTGSIKIIKDSQPNDTQNFIFDVYTSAGSTGTTELDDDGETYYRSNTHTFDKLSTGLYSISERPVSGWYLDSARCTGGSNSDSWNFSDGIVSVNIANGEDFVCTFVNKKTGTIHGYKWNDKDNDNYKDGNEEKMSGWTIFIDQDNDSELDAGERSVITDSNGNYSFDNLTPGGYKVCEVMQSGWSSTSSVCKNTTIHSNGGDRDEINFGNRQRGSIRVCKVIIDGSGNVVNGSEMGNTTFTVDWNKGLADTVINSGYNLSTDPQASDILPNVPGNDAYCITYSDLAIDNYGYSQESITGSTGWKTALYNDQYTENVSTLDDFYPYGTNTDSNGDINLALDAGPNRTLVILNQYELGSIHGYKWNDLNGDGVRQTCDEFSGRKVEFEETCTPEPLLPEWTINLYKLTEGDEGTDRELIDTMVTDDDKHFGWYWFEGLLPGQYEVCEELQSGWTQTYPNPVCHQVSLPDQNSSRLPSSDNAVSGPEYNFGNHQVDAKLSISRSNNASLALAPGNSVEHTITIKVTENNVKNLKLTDLLPNGFSFSGSYSVSSDQRGPITLANNPEYHSPGVWELGDYNKDDVITIKYLANISSDTLPGTYTDLAYATANDAYGQGLRFLALGENSEYVDENYVGTDVEVVKDQTNSEDYKVEKEEIKGEVLGASTSLPATGASPMWLMLAFVSLVYGIRLIKSSNKK